jgi:prolyl-tRNA synthetase
MGANFTDKDGKEKPLVMGCYGIGIGRLMGTIVEIFNDEKGIIWPENVAPFSIHLVSIGSDSKIIKKADEIYEKLNKKGEEILYDDREESPGVELADADLIGIPQRMVVSENTLKKDAVEVKKRSEKTSKLVKISSL